VGLGVTGYGSDSGLGVSGISIGFWVSSGVGVGSLKGGMACSSCSATTNSSCLFVTSCDATSMAIKNLWGLLICILFVGNVQQEHYTTILR
jgi:hypothetical protein